MPDTWSLVIRPRRPWFDVRLEELWHYRDLISLFVRRDFVAVYKQTILGPLWHIIQPLSRIKPAPPLSQVKQPIEQQILAQKKQQVAQAWAAGLQKKFKPQYQTGYAPPSILPTSEHSAFSSLCSLVLI